MFSFRTQLGKNATYNNATRRLFILHLLLIARVTMTYIQTTTPVAKALMGQIIRL